MKKFLGFLLVLMLIASNCFAMTFSQPVKIGEIMTDTAGKYGNGYVFEKFSSNNGKEGPRKVSPNAQKKSYVEGIASFGEGENILYLHYNMYNYDNSGQKFGDKNISNTVSAKIGERSSISQLINDSETKIYLISSSYGGMSDCFIIGKRKDGKFVKYIDTIELTKKYFGERVSIFYNDREMKFNGNTIIIPYMKEHNNNFIKGEFRFKWDDAAQWFGVEQIIY